MTALVSRAMMALAMGCLGESRREWALAMRVEFEAAAADGKGLAFASGCLVAAWREMPQQAEGRHVLATYALALGFSSVFLGGGWANGILLAGATPNPYFAWVQNSAAPCLLVLWLLLGIGHVRLAWVLVDRDWARAVKVGALIGATLATLFIIQGALFLDVTFVVMEAAAMALELAALVAVARRHARLFPDAAPDLPAR